jgi:hypothetical protein
MKIRYQIRSTAVAAVAAAFFAISLTTNGADVIIVAPNNLGNTEGNSGDTTPFGAFGPLRSQQVYGASQFSAIAQGGGWIDAISFRVDAGSTLGAATTATNLQINLSTTAKAPDGLSSTFAQNVGANDKVVFGPASLALIGYHSGSTTPQSFSIRIPFSTPFFYDPNAGNLVMDVRNFTGGSSFGVFDGQLTIGDSVSRVVGFVDAPSMFASDSFGFATQFEVTPVPEPSSWALMALCLGGLLLWQSPERGEDASKRR